MPLKISNSNPTKILRELIMNFKKSTIAIKDKNVGDLDNSKDYPTIADLIREQKVSKDESIMVHYRRDLDSLG